MKNNRGFTLIETMIALAIGAAILLVVTMLMNEVFKARRRADFLVSVAELRVTFQQALIRTSDWQETQSANPLMSCFSGATPSSCTALLTPPVHDMKLQSAGRVLFDGTSALNGFTANGAACSHYGTSDCILRPKLKWLIQCETAVDPTCVAPLVIVTLNYDYSGPDIGPNNFAGLGFSITQPTFPLKMKDACVGAIPPCTDSQAAVCTTGNWTCREFGL